MIELCGSVLAASHTSILRDIRLAEDAGISRFHIDVCDGHYTRKIIFGDQLVRELRGETPSLLEVHIAVYNTENILRQFLDTGADVISIQFESSEQPAENLTVIKNAGIQPGMTFAPVTAFGEMKPFLDNLDFVLDFVNILGVEPGIGGQEFNPVVLGKIEETADYISRKGLKTKISVDGGVNMDTLLSVKDAGADILTVGTAMFSGDIKENIVRIRGILNE
ncbi:MAG: hypothetical protein DRP60_03585 [Spirochaetes bacterium]|nr:MAG: hypothetical protein DRP60_03585 [Spirochaetota bacterium]